MNGDALITEVTLRDGRLALYAGRVAHRGEAVTEVVPLAQLASVRIAFEREAGRLGWAIGLLVAALALFLAARPLQEAMTSLATRVSAPGPRESLEAVLHAAFSALAGFAGAFPVFALVALAGAGGLGALWWVGRTTLTLTFGATERRFSMLGRNASLTEFAEALGERVSSLSRGER